MAPIALGLGVGLTSGGAVRSWTPAALEGYWLRPSLTSGVDPTITLVGSKVSAASVGGGVTLSQGNDAIRYVWSTSSPLNGYGSYDYAAGRTLASATGGVTGTGPHTIWAVMSHAGAGAYTGIVTFGDLASGASTIGNNSGKHWAGGYGAYKPNVDTSLIVPGNATYDATTHMFVKVWDGSKATFYIDGQRLGRASVDANYGYESTESVSIVSAKFGLTETVFASGSTASIRTAGWLSRAITAAERSALGRWAKSTFGLTGVPNLAYLGDSQTAGNGANTPWPAAIPPMLDTTCALVDCATAGWMTDDLIASTKYEATWPRGSDFQLNAAVVYIGGNNLYFGQTAATTWTKIQAIASKLRSEGYSKLIGIPALPNQIAGTPVGYAAEQVALRSAMLGSSGVFDAMIDAPTLFPDPLDTTWYQADKGHLNTAAEAVLAQQIATIVNAWT